jgi:hypothetical protein
VSIANVSPAANAEQTPLSPRRAFVVQFREGTGDTPDMFVGRVEHVVSGRAAHFHSARQLNRFMRRMLNAGPAHQYTAEGRR